MIRRISVSLLTIISVALISTSLPMYSFAADAPAPISMTPPEDPSVIKDARSILRGIEPSSSNNAMVYFDQNQVNFKSFISLEQHGAGQSGGEKIICLTPQDPKCVSALADSSYQQIKYDVAMGSCDARQIAACIKTLSLVKEDGTKVKAQAVQRIYSKTSPGWDSTFNAKTNTGYPGADGPWLWRITDGGKSTDYLILGLVSALFNRPIGTSTWDASEKSLRLSIYPVKKFENPAYVDGGSETACLAVDTGVCYQRIAFAPNLRFALDLRIPKVITGWLNGRLDKPSAYTENYDENYSELIVEADPLEEIMTGKWLANTGAVAQYLNDSRKGSTAAPGSKNLDIAGTDPDDQNAVRYYTALSSQFSNVALTNTLAWRLNTTSSGAQTFASTCAKIEGVQGIVTSNASVYEPGSPQWDSNEGALGYKIAAPVYKSDGKTENVGRYAFTMRADLIKCVYGMTKLPAYAKIEITYDGSGEKKTASVVLGQFKDWVNLHADNFVFESTPPTVKVKLEGWTKSAGAGKNTLPASPPNKSSPGKVAAPTSGQATITCIKGTTKKTVTGTKPICPTGYKMSVAKPTAQAPAVQQPVDQGNNQPQPEQPNQPQPGQPSEPNADITITCTKGSESKQVTGKSPVQCPNGYQMKPMQPGQPNQPQPGQPIDPNADITITCTKGSDSKQVTGKSPVQCPTGYQMQPMQPGQLQQPARP